MSQLGFFSKMAPILGFGDKSQSHDGGLSKDLAVDVHEAFENQQARGARMLLWLSLLAVAVLFAWASFAVVDEVVRGEGKVVPSRQVQVVQSLDGGVVEEILVRPGQAVEAGEVLLRIDPTRFSSSLGENLAERLSLLARAARLEALASDTPFVAPEEVLKEKPELAEMERRVFESRNEEIRAAIKSATEQLNQRRQELRETEAKRDQAASSCNLTSRELEVTRPLLKSGAVSEVDLLRLQRDVARYCGERKAAEAQIDRILAAIEEAESKVSEAELGARNQAAVELSETRAKLATLKEGELALVDRVRLAEVRSPVRGTIKSLMANTVGGVVQPGRDILDIVPSDDTLLLEVRIAPRDIGFLFPGQEASVKFTAYDFSIYGGLDGVVETIGADTIVDERGDAYYVVKVRTDRAYVGDDQRPIIPGMIADVHVLTGKRTIMHYLLKPILRAKSNALTER
ncbi:MAG TPA: HlyD family type I secretion periplasmic adaptor subunit [Pusillimonas sp.]|uniref:HlyD family type I secretion periplasmic adaptor subunit n=1 Tax=Pusillimonas sp. TaxID=3040095 RepID=UPI002B4B9230|nr:HlyD family type I secretion periplasmic adaptor subunit [Pusillimonas sp.]HLU18315.1 HlyD family type I secretion periplasmic adaptor subunit [Pusillimonas sp.]